MKDNKKRYSVRETDRERVRERKRERERGREEWHERGSKSEVERYKLPYHIKKNFVRTIQPYGISLLRMSLEDYNL